MNPDVENDEMNIDPKLKKIFKLNDNSPLKISCTMNMDLEDNSSEQLSMIDDYIRSFEENKSDIIKIHQRDTQIWNKDYFIEYDPQESQVQNNSTELCEKLQYMRLLIVSIKVDLKQLNSFDWNYPDMFKGILLKDFLNQVLFILSQEELYCQKEREYFMLGPANSKLKQGELLKQLLQTKDKHGNLIYSDFLVHYDRYLRFLLVRKTFHIPFEEVRSLFVMWSKVHEVRSKLPYSIDKQEILKMNDLIELIDCPSYQDRNSLLDRVKEVKKVLGLSNIGGGNSNQPSNVYQSGYYMQH